jgi:hypothetical protein
MLAFCCVLILAQGVPPAPPVTPTPTASNQPHSPLALLSVRPIEQRSGQGESLADVAKRIKLRMPAGKPRLITNENLAGYSAGVQLTTTNGLPDSTVVVSDSGNEDEKKLIWQTRYREALDHAAHWEAEVHRLDNEVARLQSDFYARDDPAYRDGVIKPAWDQAILDLQNARIELANARSEPDRVSEAARRDGALPGWFRGITPSPPGGQGDRSSSNATKPPARRGPA